MDPTFSADVIASASRVIHPEKKGMAVSPMAIFQHRESNNESFTSSSVSFCASPKLAKHNKRALVTPIALRVSFSGTLRVLWNI